MTRMIDLDEKLLSQASMISGIENPNVLMQMLLNDFVRMRKPESFEVKSSEKKNAKLVERLIGCISKERAEELHKELEEMRNEWERDIY